MDTTDFTHFGLPPLCYIGALLFYAELEITDLWMKKKKHAIKFRVLCDNSCQKRSATNILYLSNMSPMNKIAQLEQEKKHCRCVGYSIILCRLQHVSDSAHSIYLYHSINATYRTIVWFANNQNAKEWLCYEKPQFYRWNNTRKKSIHTKRLSFNISNICLPVLFFAFFPCPFRL